MRVVYHYYLSLFLLSFAACSLNFSEVFATGFSDVAIDFRVTSTTENCGNELKLISQPNAHYPRYTLEKSRIRIANAIAITETRPSKLIETMGDMIFTAFQKVMHPLNCSMDLEPFKDGSPCNITLMPGSDPDKLFIVIEHTFDKESPMRQKMNAQLANQLAENPGFVFLFYPVYRQMMEAVFTEGSFSDLLAGKPVKFVLTEYGQSEYAEVIASNFEQASLTTKKQIQDQLKGSDKFSVTADVVVTGKSLQAMEFSGTLQKLNWRNPDYETSIDITMNIDFAK